MRRHPSIARMLDSVVRVEPGPLRLTKQVMPSSLRQILRGVVVFGILAILAAGDVAFWHAGRWQASRSADVEAVGRMMLQMIHELSQPADRP